MGIRDGKPRAIRRRVCKSCGKRRPLTKFKKDPNCRFGRRWTCHKCHYNKWVAKWRKNNPEMMREASARQYYRDPKGWVKQAKERQNSCPKRRAAYLAIVKECHVRTVKGQAHWQRTVHGRLIGRSPTPRKDRSYIIKTLIKEEPRTKSASRKTT